MTVKNIADLNAGVVVAPAGADLMEIQQGGINKPATAQSIANLSFISGTFTSAQVLQNFPAATNAGRAVYVTDLACTLLSDGIRWNVISTPAVPPGAALLGYKTNVYTVIPSLAEIAFTSSLARVYNGCTILGPANPNAGTYSTAANGQLQLSWNTGANNASGLCTEKNLNGQALAGSLGSLPFLLGSQGFYAEIAFTLSGNNLDNWFSFYFEPQEHNTAQNDANPAFPSPYAQWHEFDINENGFGTNLGGNGTSRGAYHQWSGIFNGPVTLASAPAQGATSITLASVWPGETSTAGHPWVIKLSSGETHNVTLVNGSVGPYTITAVVNAGNTTAATVTFTGLVVTSNVQTASIDYTVEHIIGGAYDPIGQTFTLWQDGVKQSVISTSNPNSSNTFRDSLHYFPLITMQSRGANLPYTATVRYFSAWAP